MVNYEVSIKNEFLISALFAENMITKFLSDKLNVKNIVKSKFLGNNNSAINFDQKFDLLLESNKFSIIDKSKLSVFRSICDEFRFNKNADSIEDSFTSDDHNDDFLLILYPQSDSIPRENKLINACYQLIDEVTQLVHEFTKSPKIKFNRRIFSLNSKVLNYFAFLVFFLLINN